MDKETRFHNLYDAFTSQLDYCHYVESYGEDQVDFKKTNFDILRALYAGFYLTLIIDEFMEIDENKNINCHILPHFMETVMSLICEPFGTGYKIGELCYKDVYTVLEKTRNKLAHGDFIIENGDIIFEENGARGVIHLDNLIEMLNVFESNYEDYDIYKRNTRTFSIIQDGAHKINVSDSRTFDKMSRNLSLVEIEDYPQFPRVRSINYIETLSDFYKEVEELSALTKLNKKLFDKLINKYSKQFKQYGIIIKVTNKPLQEEPYYDVLKQHIMSELKDYQYASPELMACVLQNKAYKLSKGEQQKFNMRKGIIFNETILSLLNDNPNMGLREIISKNKTTLRYSLNHFDDVIMSTYLVVFNSLYEYGLEKCLTDKGNYDLAQIFRGDSIDFSKFDFSSVDDPNMLIEHKFECYLSDVDKYKNKIPMFDSRIDHVLNKTRDYITNCKNQSNEKLEEFASELKEVQKDKKEFLDFIHDLESFENSFDHSKYVRNINIIEHIRNAVAHGNVFVNPYSADNIKDTEITIIDYLDDQVVYQKTLKIIEFAELFSFRNLDVLFDFISGNIRDPQKVDYNFLENTLIRLSKRKQYSE